MSIDTERRRQRAALISLIEREGHWSERVWLPLLRLVHRLAGNS